MLSKFILSYLVYQIAYWNSSLICPFSMSQWHFEISWINWLCCRGFSSIFRKVLSDQWKHIPDTVMTMFAVHMHAQCMKWPVTHSPNSTWFWLELVGNCCERLKIIMKYTNIQFCERLGHGWLFHPLHAQDTWRVNPLHAKFFRGNINNIYILCHSSTLIWHRYLKSSLK